MTKTGDSTNTENSEFYGINAGVLTTEGVATTIKSSNISTDAKVYLSDCTINTTGESSARGLDATYGSAIN